MYRSGTVLAFSSEQTRNDRLNPESASAGSWDWALTCEGREGTVGGIRQAPSFAAGLLAVPAFISLYWVSCIFQ